MKAIFYDGLGLNEWLFNALYLLNVPIVDAGWRVLSYGYSYWVPALLALVLCTRYLKIRHVASASQLATMSDIMAVLILSFSLICCAVYTFQTVTLWPSPWAVYPDLVAAQTPLLWHEGFPATASAIAMMVSSIFWRYATAAQKGVLVAYVVLACLFSVVSGQNWPSDVIYGLLAGALGVWLARRYYQFGIRWVAS